MSRPLGYRVCRNSQPHFPDFWTVERLIKVWFRPRWEPVCQYRLGAFGAHKFKKYFLTEAAALAWIEEDRKPFVHECKDVT